MVFGVGSESAVTNGLHFRRPLPALLRLRDIDAFSFALANNDFPSEDVIADPLNDESGPHHDAAKPLSSHRLRGRLEAAFSLHPGGRL